MEKDWQPELRLLRPFWLRFVFVICFVGLNMLVVVYAPKERRDGGEFRIDRMWWPYISFMILVGSFLYWLTLTVPQQKKSSDGQTIGQSLGFEVTVYREDDRSEPWPVHMRGDMMQARDDGTGRRVKYKASIAALSIGRRLMTRFSYPEIFSGLPTGYQK